MTAELSQLFRTKREGVHYVLDALESVIPADQLHIYTVDGAFVDLQTARQQPMRVAASNWHATAAIVSHTWQNAVLIDIGTTTTDVIPICDGTVAPEGNTDPDRLRSGELVYTGAVRTPVEAIIQEVPLNGELAGVSAEGFALAGDIYVWLRELNPDDYSSPTPDGRPVTRDFVRERLARIVCADRELLDDTAIDHIAQSVKDAQIGRITRALAKVVSRHNSISTAVTAGVGAFLATYAARRCGLSTLSLAETLGADASRSAPAAAVALLLDRALKR